MKRIMIAIGINSMLLSAGTLNWGDPKAIEQGKGLFAKNCAVCHGKQAEGRGHFPSLKAGHVTHHPPQKLMKQIAEGGGGMPPFKNKLTRQERQATLMYIHSLWSTKMKMHYKKKFKLKGKK